MKFYETHFEEYLKKARNMNFHSKLENIWSNISGNLILYGPSGSGKYSQALLYLSRLSPSDLKYEKKVCMVYNKDNFFFKVSDIHIEINMDLLGCNAKSLWHEVYNQILDIANTKPERKFTVLCKNFDSTHSELLSIFYSYMQTIEMLEINYILLCENTNFIPNTILERCNIIAVPKPTKQLIKKNFGSSINYGSNLKNNYIQSSLEIEPICDEIIENALYPVNFSDLRESIYNIFVLNLNENECIYRIMKLLSEKEIINKTNALDAYINVYEFYKLYNNNYRPIYHLEKLIFSLII